MRIGLIKENKQPPDTRVVLTPDQVESAIRSGIEVRVEPSPHRCFPDETYESAGASVGDVSTCDVLLGVKEVPVAQLLPNKTYCFFSHTIKGQAHNMPLLRAVLDKHITLIDFEGLANERGERVIAFGKWAGVVGAHNGLMAYGRRTGLFSFPRVSSFPDFRALKAFYEKITLPPMKIVVAGSGRVAKGALEVLSALHAHGIDPDAFVAERTDQALFTELGSDKLYRRRDDQGFSYKQFYAHPELYESAFRPYLTADILINAIYWNPLAPPLFTLNQMSLPEFHLQTIADITCDVNGSVPATMRPSTIAEPVYGFDPRTRTETPPYQPSSVDIMAIDNLPNELPRDASRTFGEMFLKNVLPELLKDKSRMLDQATIARGGRLTERYHYLGERLALP